MYEWNECSHFNVRVIIKNQYIMVVSSYYDCHQRCSILTMNFIWISFVTLSIFTFTAETIEYGSAVVKRKLYNAPLALTQWNDSPRVELATPHKNGDHTSTAVYNYIIKNDNNGPKEKFLTACPAHTNSQVRKQSSWRAANEFGESQPRLFFIEKYRGEKMTCNKSAVPGIQKKYREDSDDVAYCGERGQAESYKVGFWVSMDEDAKDIQFVTIFEICYSTALAASKPYEGTLYTTHHINSPDLMLLKVEDNYEADPLNSFRSFLDNDLSKLNKFYKDYFAHTFVGRYDMPTKVWELATMFPFNYTPIPKQLDLYKDMINIDNYIRLFALKKQKRLQLHSGTYKTSIEVQLSSCISFCHRTIVLKSFWRIISDDELNAALIVTQYSEHKLDNCGDKFICQDSTRKMLRTYEKGGCAYTCPMSNEIFLQLGYPSFKITGSLALTIEFIRTKKKQKSQTEPQGGDQLDAEVDTINANINDFMSGAEFVVVLAKFDSEFAAMLTDGNEGSAEGDEGHSAEGDGAEGDVAEASAVAAHSYAAEGYGADGMGE